MTTNESQPEPCFYTPERVRSLLRSLPYLPGHRVTDDDRETDPLIRSRRYLDSWPLENSLCIKADIERELKALPSFTRDIVHRAYVMGDSDSHMATINRCDRETVKRHRIDGTELMAHRLGWRGKRAAEQRRTRSATSWRNPRLEAGGST